VEQVNLAEVLPAPTLEMRAAFRQFKVQKRSREGGVASGPTRLCTAVNLGP
jgi:hypothetical protein